MLSQLNLRFPKKLIEALKVRARQESTSVNALAERFLDDGLATATAGDGFFQLLTDPESTARQLYRRIVLGQAFGLAPVSRDELRFMLTYAREGFLPGRNRVASLPAFSTLLQITRDLLAWQEAHAQPVDSHYLKGIFRLTGENLTEEFDAFLTELRPVIDQVYAENLLRPLISGCFRLTDFPDTVLADIFTLPRLKAIFPLILRGLGWTDEKAESLAREMRPLIAAQVHTIEAGTLRVDLRIDGQPAGQRPGAWYETPRLHVLITGQEFVVPCAWAHFSELLGLLDLYARYPEALQHGHQGEHVMFSPPGHVIKEGFFGIDGLRIFLPAKAFETMVSRLTLACREGALAAALTELRSLYGDI